MKFYIYLILMLSLLLSGIQALNVLAQDNIAMLEMIP